VVAEAMTEEVLKVRLVDPNRRALRRAECAARVALAADWKKWRGECILNEGVQRANKEKI